MATNLSPQNHAVKEEEDYIDMELTSSPSSSSPQNSSREFEFQMSHTLTTDKETAAAADELFFNGKLLPLHVTTTTTKNPFSENHHYYYYSSKTPLILPIMTCSTAPCTNTTNTPSESCNISPSESCRASCELNPDEYFFQWSTELSSFIGNNHHHHHPTKKHWYSKRLKLRQKLKASRTYLKSLFTKSACSDETSAKANTNDAEADNSNKYFKIINYAKNKKQKLFGDDNVNGRGSYIPTVAAIMKNNIDRDHGISEDNNNVHRRSFSGALKRHSPAKCLSSSSSNSSSSSSSNFSLNSINGFREMRFLRRSSSVTEIEGSIEAAIAHCKKSQLQILDSRNLSGGIGI